MKKKTKMYLRLNLISLFFVVVSFISVTLAWFVYSGLSTVHTEVSVKAWYIELEKNGEKVSNDIVISLEDIYPGMEPIEEVIKIKNLGDSDAQIKYKIISARILDIDNYLINEQTPTEQVEDILSHQYPFHINIDLSKKFVVAKTDETVFKVSVSWPLDSGDDELDSYWGSEAHRFKTDEQKKKNLDKNYQMSAAIKLDVSLTAEQYIESPEASDIRFRLGNEILYDVSLNKRCYEESATCIRTNLIDVNNTLQDTQVTLLPKISNETFIGTFDNINSLFASRVAGWNVKSRLLTAEEILMIASKDILNSVLVRPSLSDLIIGDLKYGNRVDNVIEIAKSDSGYFKFLNKFTYLNSETCYWVNNEYDLNNAFAVLTNDEKEETQLYAELKTTECKVIPVIIADKVNL